MANGNEDAHQRDLEQAIRLDGRSVSAYNRRSIQKFDSGDTSAALADINHALALNPEYAPAALIGMPALFFLYIAAWGSRRSVGAAKSVADVTTLLP